MSFITKIGESLRGARRVEIMLILALISLAALAYFGNGGVGDASSTSLERRMEKAISALAGAGDVRVMVTEDAEGSVIGVMVAAEGAGDISVMLEIQRAVRTLTGIGLDRIDVTRMGGK